MTSKRSTLQCFSRRRPIRPGRGVPIKLEGSFKWDKPTLCPDCGRDTTPYTDKHKLPRAGQWEYYMVQNAVWKAARIRDGFLCVGSLEGRLGRTLKPRGFLNVLTNGLFSRWASPRLRDRRSYKMGLENKGGHAPARWRTRAMPPAVCRRAISRCNVGCGLAPTSDRNESRQKPHRTASLDSALARSWSWLKRSPPSGATHGQSRSARAVVMLEAGGRSDEGRRNALDWERCERCFAFWWALVFGLILQKTANKPENLYASSKSWWQVAPPHL